jgi:hypothetical protein
MPTTGAQELFVHELGEIYPPLAIVEDPAGCVYVQTSPQIARLIAATLDGSLEDRFEDLPCREVGLR